MQVYGALIHACSQEIQHMRPVNRRLQLVLLERAASIFDDMEKAHIMPDSVIWNAFIAAAGRAGQLQRAFDALTRMQVSLPAAVVINLSRGSLGSFRMPLMH